MNIIYFFHLRFQAVRVQFSTFLLSQMFLVFSQMPMKIDKTVHKNNTNAGLRCALIKKSNFFISSNLFVFLFTNYIF